jgi:3',5'-cyclic AMP phosphodiesterase CpdA
MNSTLLTRRDAMRNVGAAALGAAAWSGLSVSATAAQISPTRKRSLRLAHLTDIHVESARRAPEGMRSCLEHVQQLNEPVELILTGGDHVMETFGADDVHAKSQWDLWNNGLKNDCSLPVRSTIGNHDIWGWNKTKSKTTGKEPNYGKQRATEMLHLDNRYYTFAQSGWQFIVLDSVRHHPTLADEYTCHLDEKQYDWLESTLRDLPSTMPVLLLSHVPILSASVVMWSQQEHGNFRIGGYLMHSDGVKLKDLFAKYPNVKLSLSGHLHLTDRVDYNGVTYLCNGAVCGNWWKGRHKDCDEGYAVMNLYDDGSFEHEYIKYGWTAQV